MENAVSLYDLLNVARTATLSEITKAYRVLALRYHPDKNPDDREGAIRNFQQIQKAYNILKDEDKRRVYDRTGELEDCEAFMEAYSYYRERFGRMTFEDIDAFALEYKDSPAEQEDLVDFYLKQRGNMIHLLHYIPLSGPSDVSRFMQIYDRLILEQVIPKYKTYDRTRDKVQMIDEDLDEDLGKRENPKALTDSNFQNLVDMIRNKG